LTHATAFLNTFRKERRRKGKGGEGRSTTNSGPFVVRKETVSISQAAVNTFFSRTTIASKKSFIYCRSTGGNGQTLVSRAKNRSVRSTPHAPKHFEGDLLGIVFAAISQLPHEEVRGEAAKEGINGVDGLGSLLGGGEDGRVDGTKD
jgi:hypothetical protein